MTMKYLRERVNMVFIQMKYIGGKHIEKSHKVHLFTWHVSTWHQHDMNPDICVRQNIANSNQTTVNWAQLSNRRYVDDTDMLPGSYPHRKSM